MNVGLSRHDLYTICKIYFAVLLQVKNIKEMAAWENIVSKEQQLQRPAKYITVSLWGKTLKNAINESMASDQKYSGVQNDQIG